MDLGEGRSPGDRPHRRRRPGTIRAVFALATTSGGAAAFCGSGAGEVAGVAGPGHSLGGQSMDRLESSETHEERRAAQVSRRSFMTQVAAGVVAAPLVGGALAGCAQTSLSAKA